MQLYVYPEDLYEYAKRKNAFTLKKDDFLHNVQVVIQSTWDNDGIVRFKDFRMKMELSIVEEKQ